MQIPFVDLKRQYDSIQGDLDQRLNTSIKDFTFLKGRSVTEFQAAFAASVQAECVVPTANGTDSLFLALKAIQVTAEDEVITPAWSWISSSETISLCGAKPVFVDVDPNTYVVSATAVREKITSKTKAIICVHIYGQAAEAQQIREMCDRRGIYLIEDCAQAHFTKEHNCLTGTIGHLGAFSFYPTKNLGAYGDAGCVVTNDPALAERVRRLANHGALEKDDHLMEGMNSRMDTIQAAVLLAKLPYIEEWTNKRIANAKLYTESLQGVLEVVTPFVRPATRHTFHIYAIRAQRRDELKAFLASHGIETMIHYPKALTNLPAYKYLNLNPADFPVANALEKEVLSLPIYPELTESEILYVCEKIKAFYK